MKRMSAIGIRTLFSCMLIVCTASSAYADRDPRTGEIVGDVAARDFSTYCAGELPPKRRVEFEREFAIAEARLSAGGFEEAEAAMGRAFSAAYRGGADTELSIKCLGREIAGRWFDARLEIDRLRSKTASSRRPARSATLRVLAVDQGPDALIEHVKAMRVQRFVSAFRFLEQTASRLEGDRNYGAFMLADEERLEATCRTALDALRQYAGRAHDGAMARERTAFEAGPGEQDRRAAELASDAHALAEAFVGDAADLGLDEAAIALRNRARASRQWLEKAQQWNLEHVGDRQSMPSSHRARGRGDQLMARARDASASLALRDTCYAAAKRYFELGGFGEAAKTAEAEHATIEGALRAEGREREARIDRATAKLKNEAESIKRSVDDMRKTESEKKSFEDEAKAMEDELGF